MNVILSSIYSLLQKYINNGFICKVRLSPDEKLIIVDINYNKALSIHVRNNTVYIEGNKIDADKLKAIIEKEIKNANN